MDWASMSAAELGREIEAGRIDPRELTALFINMARLEDSGHRIFVRLLNGRATWEAGAAASTWGTRLFVPSSTALALGVGCLGKVCVGRVSVEGI